MDEVISKGRAKTIERLIKQLSETERKLQELGAGELDAVVDRDSATTILLRHAQRAISQSEARFRNLVNRCPALVCEIDHRGQVAFVNDAVRTLLGHDPDSAAGTAWVSLVPRKGRAAAADLGRMVRVGDVTGFELPLETASGDERWMLLNTANRYDSTGKLEMVVAFAIDITERKRADEAARQLVHAERARVNAEAANKAKTDFLAVMSHELRTPLNAIGGYSELIEMGLRGPVTPAQTEDLGKIRRSQRHLLGLINDIMNFARLETGHVSLRFRDVVVNETLAVLDALTEPQVAAKRIRYERGRCEPGLTAWADEEKTRQILINLVSNAIKFTESGGTIAISCVADDETVRFKVRDSGRGIAKEKLELIFEPFVQVNKEFTRDEGVGLGLAISRDLARMMHGELTAESNLGVGSTFTLALPRREPRPARRN
jgi:PAS domain S-box-containing protein